jgi:site-specific DNA recombinase
MLKNEAYRGTTLFGKTTASERRSRLRPHRGQEEHPRRVRSLISTPRESQIPIPVPALVTDELFAATQEHLHENKKRNRRPPQGVRYLLQGLLVCKRCGYSYCGQSMTHARKNATSKSYQYYFCTGTMFGRCDRERVCWNRSVHRAYREKIASVRCANPDSRNPRTGISAGTVFLAVLER